MHDLHEADKILKLILEYAGKNKMRKVEKASIELGAVIEHGEEIKAENLEFNIKNLAKGTVADGLEVDIKRGKGEFWKLVSIEGE